MYAALPRVEELVREAEAEVEAARQSARLSAYREARAAEEQAAAAADKKLRTAADALSALRDAGRHSYELGVLAGVEKATHSRRRSGAFAAWVGTVLGDALPDIQPRNRDVVTDYVSRLRSLIYLPED